MAPARGRYRGMAPSNLSSEAKKAVSLMEEKPSSRAIYDPDRVVTLIFRTVAPAYCGSSAPNWVGGRSYFRHTSVLILKTAAGWTWMSSPIHGRHGQAPSML